MARDTSNGAYWALGLAGLAAGAAALMGRSGSASARHAGSCSCCGIGLHGSPNESDEDDVEEEAELRGTFLLRNRFDAVNAFSTSAEDSVALRGKFVSAMAQIGAYYDALSEQERLAASRRQGEELRWVFQVGKLIDVPGQDGSRLAGIVDAEQYATMKADSKASLVARALSKDPNKVYPPNTEGLPQIKALAEIIRRDKGLSRQQRKSREPERRQYMDAVALAYRPVYLRRLFLDRAWSIGLLDGYINLDRYRASKGGTNRSQQFLGAPDYLDERQIGVLEQGRSEQVDRDVSGRTRKEYELRRKADLAIFQRGDESILLLRTPEVSGALPIALGRGRRLPVYGTAGEPNLFSNMQVFLRTDGMVDESDVSLPEGSGREDEELRRVFRDESRAAASSRVGNFSPVAASSHNSATSRMAAEKAEDVGVEDNEMHDASGVPELHMVGTLRLLGRDVKTRVALFFLAENGAMYFDYGILRVPLLTKTSKMSSPSFGLPAGIVKEGGTCPARKFGQRAMRAKSQQISAAESDLRAVQESLAMLGGAGPLRRPGKGGEHTSQQAAMLAKIEPLLSQISASRGGKKAPSPYSKPGLAVLRRHLAFKIEGLKEELASYQRKLICDRCYAMGANYGYANNMIAQEARRRWVIGMLPKGSPGRPEYEEQSRVLACSLAIMVASYAKFAWHPKRSIQEIGIWDDKSSQITFRTVKGRSPCDKTDLRLKLTGAILRPVQLDQASSVRFRAQVQRLRAQGKLVGQISKQRKKQIQASLVEEQIEGGPLMLGGSPVKTSFEWFSKIGVQGGKVCGFFRVHDSGDFGVQSPSSSSGPFAYIEAWSRAASILPYVQFWAPTRTWAAMKSDKKASDSDRRFNRSMMNEISVGSRPTKSLHPDLERGAPLKTYELWSQGQGSKSFVSALAQSNTRSTEPSASTTRLAPGEDGLQNLSIDAEMGMMVAQSERYVSALRELSENNPNFALRPSTLYVTRARLVDGQRAQSTGQSANIPYIEGLSAGSGVVEKAEHKAYPVVHDMRGVQAYACPVYTKDDKGQEAKSCRDAHCRACWLAQNLPVFYGAH